MSNFDFLTTGAAVIYVGNVTLYTFTSKKRNLQKSSAVAGKIIANAQTKLHTLGSKITKDNQG